MDIKKTQEHLSGVKCTVNTCYYHENGNHCNAEKIEVNPINAKTVEETDCGTFKHQSMH